MNASVARRGPALVPAETKTPAKSTQTQMPGKKKEMAASAPAAPALALAPSVSASTQESKRRKQLTRFERAHAIRCRANAIAAGAPVRLKDTRNCTDSLVLAERELEERLLGDYVVRKCYPDGSYEEFGIYELAHVHK